MWKSASRTLKSVFSKHQSSHNNIPTREARNDKSVNCFRKLSPVFFGDSHRYYGCEGRGRGQFTRNDKKENPKTDKRNFLNDFQQDLLGALRWSGIFALGWYILKPFSHRKVIFSQEQSDKCAFLILSRFTRNEYMRLINYFTNVQPILHVLPKIEAAKPKKNDGIYEEDKVDELDFDNITKAHHSVMGSLINSKGADCMTRGCYTDAVEHFQDAARVQHPGAIYNLGVCYEMGLGTNQDLKKAADMYKRASDLGHPTATYNLGVFYVHGLGNLKTDLNEARKLFQIAASQGQPNAQKALDMEANVDAQEKIKINDVPNVAEAKSFNDNSRQVELSSRKHGKFNLFNVSSLINAVKNDKTELDSSSSDDSGALDLSPEVQVLLN